MRVSNLKVLVALVTSLALFATLLLPQPAADAQTPGGPDDWAVLPALILGEPQTYFGIEMDRRTGLLHLTNTRTDRIDIFEPTGRFVESYGDDQHDYPADVAFMDDSIYVSYFTSGEIVRYDRTTLQKQASVSVEGQPVGVDAADGEVYVAVRDAVEAHPDRGGRIAVLARDLQEVRSHTLAGHLFCVRPNDVVVQDADLIVVYIPVDPDTQCSGEPFPGRGPIDRNLGSREDVNLSGVTVFGLQGAYAATSGPDGTVYATATGGVARDRSRRVLIPLDAAATGITIDPSGRTMWVVDRRGLGVLVPMTLERCMGRVPTDVGSIGNDTVERLKTDVVVWAGPGDDFVTTGDGDNVVCGGAGDDVVLTGDGLDRISGGPGNDRLVSELGVDVIFGGSGHDAIISGGGSDWIYGQDGVDNISAGSGADRVYGGPGNDLIFGQGGQDFLWGEAGNDDIQGNWQSDHIYGGPGNDILRGAAGKDKIYGGTGNDELYGGTNTDYLDGGPDLDFANGQKGKDNPLVTNVSGCIAETRISC